MTIAEALWIIGTHSAVYLYAFFRGRRFERQKNTVVGLTPAMCMRCHSYLEDGRETFSYDNETFCSKACVIIYISQRRTEDLP